MLRDDESGQAHTLEAIVGGILIIATIIFAVQATAITPLTVSTSHEHIETQQRSMADGVLSNAQNSHVDSGVTVLEDALLSWDTTNQTFDNASASGYLGSYPDNRFGEILDITFTDRRVATNIYVTYRDGVQESETQQYVHMGEPSANSVSATTTVVLYDHYPMTAPGETGTISDTSDFYAPDAFPSSTVYNVVEVRIVTWRI